MNGMTGMQDCHRWLQSCRVCLHMAYFFVFTNSYCFLLFGYCPYTLATTVSSHDDLTKIVLFNCSIQHEYCVSIDFLLRYMLYKALVTPNIPQPYL